MTVYMAWWEVDGQWDIIGLYANETTARMAVEDDRASTSPIDEFVKHGVTALEVK